jgi:hypothetical protein
MDTLGIERRRLGTGLLAFGLVGLVLAAVVAAGLIAGAVAARNLDDRLAADQARIVELLDQLVATVDRTAVSAGNASDTLATTGRTVASAAVMLDGLAVVADQLADSLDFSIFGQQPLAGAAVRFGELAVQVRAVGEDVDALAANLDTTSGDVAALAADIDRLAGQVDAIALRIADFDRTAELVDLLVAGILLLGLLVAWLAVGAAFTAWAGWRLRRAPDAPVRPGADRPGLA